jgi:hypothetical protein
MDALLFLGREYLAKMTSTNLTSEEREDYQHAFAAYTTTEEGIGLSPQLVRAFNRLSVQDILSLSPEILLWYLDWLDSQTDSVIAAVDGSSLARVWFAFPDQLLRTRTMNFLLQLDLHRQNSPPNSAIAIIHRHFLDAMEERRLPEEQMPSLDLFIEILLTDAILAREGAFARQVLRYCLSNQPEALLSASLASIEKRLSELAPSDATFLRREIWPE